ncbi:hypothetical protein SDC9_188513 [bioreactor metagenome]|uniref:Uncharacterized protein n=1 Tax=bioreactor metagenome TaxID=1076179 RepID=A0A645I0B0_9ZZZZ
MARLTPYDRNRKDVPVHPFFRRLKSLSFAVERHPDAKLAPAMDALLLRCGAGDYISPSVSAFTPSYMMAYLGLCLASAACRCGGRKGAEILTGYLEDVHVFFREHARQVLRETSGGNG